MTQLWEKREVLEPPVLRCPGCQVAMEQHEDHGRCPECGSCWQDGLTNKAVIHLKEIP